MPCGCEALRRADASYLTGCFFIVVVALLWSSTGPRGALGSDAPQMPTTAAQPTKFVALCKNACAPEVLRQGGACRPSPP